MTTIGIIQICRYDRGTQRVSRTCSQLVTLVIAMVAIYGMALLVSTQFDSVLLSRLPVSTLGFLYLLSYVKLAMTLIKYIPQVMATPFSLPMSAASFAVESYPSSLPNVVSLHDSVAYLLIFSCLPPLQHIAGRPELQAKVYGWLERSKCLDRLCWRHPVNGSANTGHDSPP